MDKTPVSKCKSLSRIKPTRPTDILRRKDGIGSTHLTCTSPVIDTADSENDDSFTQIASTQEGCENIDVVWDWNSPQAKQRPKKAHKRLQLIHSPKIPIKRHPSNHSIQDFEKLREELKLLRDEIAKPEHEDLLQLSPVEEAAYKSINIADDDAYLNSIEQDNFSQPQLPTQELFADDLFSDSFDEQLIQCSQQVELNTFSNEIHEPKEGKSDTFNKNPSPKKDVPQKSILFKRANTDINRVANDSFEALLGETKLDNLITRVTNSYTSEIRPGKVEFHRTKSFEMSTMNTLSGTLDKNKLDEIERKRKEALAKLELKKKQGIVTNSPIQCSMEEIEQKRLQALAKREAKRQQDIIEQKRQEAVRRLEMSRKKNATAIKSSLSTRLY